MYFMFCLFLSFFMVMLFYFDICWISCSGCFFYFLSRFLTVSLNLFFYLCILILVIYFEWWFYYDVCKFFGLNIVVNVVWSFLGLNFFVNSKRIKSKVNSVFNVFFYGYLIVFLFGM